MDNSYDTEDDGEPETESDTELDNGVDDSQTPELQDARATQTVPRLIRPTGQSINHDETALMIVSSMETRRNMGNKKQ